MHPGTQCGAGQVMQGRHTQVPPGSREGMVRAETLGAQALLTATCCCRIVMQPTVQFPQDNPSY